MSSNASNLLNKLRQSGNDSTIAEAKRWLDKNSNDKTAIEIINEIEYRTGNTQDVRWCAQWLRNHTDTTELEKALGKESHVRVLLEEERIQEKHGPESGRQLDNLLDLGVSESIIILTEKWLVDFPDADYADFVLISLLRAKPSQQHIALARDWLTRNTNESTSDLVLAKLIECDGSPDLLPSAAQSLKKFVEVPFTAELACMVVKHAKDQAAQALAID